MNPILSMQAEVALVLGSAAFLLSYALLVGNGCGQSREELEGPTGSGDNLFRLMWRFKLNACSWQLPGIKVDPNQCCFADVGLACSAEYTSRFGGASQQIPL